MFAFPFPPINEYTYLFSVIEQYIINSPRDWEAYPKVRYKVQIRIPRDLWKYNLLR